MLLRHIAFVVYAASGIPLVRPADLRVAAAPCGLRTVEATFRNEGMIPTRARHAIDKRIGPPDVATIEGASLEVLAGGVVDPATGRLAEPEVRRPERLRLEQGLPGDGSVRLRWIVRGTGPITIVYEARKGGRATLSADL